MDKTVKALMGKVYKIFKVVYNWYREIEWEATIPEFPFKEIAGIF